MDPTKKAGDNRFVVHLDSGNKAKDWDVRSHLNLLLWATMIAFTLCWAASYFIEDEEHLHLLGDVQGVAVLLAALLISIPRRKGGGDQKAKAKSPVLSAVVDIRPLGVQIFTTTAAKMKEGGCDGRKTTSDAIVGTPRFLPLEDIYDVIVNEIVMGRSVESKVMFRVRLDGGPRAEGDKKKKKNGAATDESRSSTIFQLLRDGSIELVDAFPPVKLSHVQCLEFCEQISNAIDRFSGNNACTGRMPVK